MSKINLAKALKLKNSLITEINRAKAILVRENSRSEHSTSQVDRAATWKLIEDKTSELIALKGKITVANIGIYPVLAQLEEAKSAIAYVITIPTLNGLHIERSYGSGEPAKTHYDAFFTQEKVDQTIAEFQKKVEAAQDAVDSYNATTFIEV